MAESIGSRQGARVEFDGKLHGDRLNQGCDHGPSEEFHDPHCEPCSDGKGLNLPVYCYCHECYQFLCNDCQNTHRRLKVTKNHKIQKGEDMPKSIAAKPPRFDFCDIHTHLIKDHFCAGHKKLICSSCHTSDHQGCYVETVETYSKTLKCSDIGDLKRVICKVQKNLQPVETAIETNVTKIKDQRKMMLKDAQLRYDKVIERVNHLYQETKAEIETRCHTELIFLAKHQETTSHLTERVNTSVTDIEQLQANAVDTKTFLRLQDTVSDFQCSMHELKNLNQYLKFASLSFVPGAEIVALLSVADFGCVKRAETEPCLDISVPDVTFPMTTTQPTHLSALPTSVHHKPTKKKNAVGKTKLVMGNTKLDDVECKTA